MDNEKAINKNTIGNYIKQLQENPLGKLGTDIFQTFGLSDYILLDTVELIESITKADTKTIITILEKAIDNIKNPNYSNKYTNKERAILYKRAKNYIKKLN